MIRYNLVDGRIPVADLEKIINGFSTLRFKKNRAYYMGENYTIKNRKYRSGQPSNRTAVAYGKLIIDTVVGYMFKPGLVTYEYDDEKTEAALIPVLEDNNEETITSDMGEQTSLQGIGFEVHWQEDRKPKFAQIPVDEMIPIYDYGIIPELVAAIRIDERAQDEIYYDVYYSTEVVTYQKNKDSTMSILEENKHLYKQVPVVVYKNNNLLLGDFEPVLDLIDNYDQIMSNAMNESDRFALAYMLLKGYGGAADDESFDEMKDRGFIGVTEDGSITFLERNIPHEFFDFMLKKIQKDIHKISSVPDLSDDSMTSGATGKAIEWMYQPFEQMAAKKEALFKQGLRKRIELIASVLNAGIFRRNKIGNIDIHFQRNKPGDEMEQVLIREKLRGSGITDVTLNKRYCPWLEDAEEEYENWKEENEVALYDDTPEADMEADTRDREQSDEGAIQ